jgi:hypothetical protein
MRQTIFILTGTMVFLSIVILLFVRFVFVVGEGYPTWSAARNFLIRSGEIRIKIPTENRILSAHCDDPESILKVNGQSVVTKIGYAWCTIEVRTLTHDSAHTYFFNPRKENSWNRIHFFPVESDDPKSDFTKVENGVEISHTDVIRESVPIRSKAQNTNTINEAGSP